MADLTPSSFAARHAGLGLAALAGVLYFLGFVGYDQFYLTWIAFVPALWALRGATPRRAFGVGLVMGWVMHLGGYPWVIHLLREFAHFKLPLAALGYVLLTLVQGGLLWGLWAWATRKAADGTGLPLGLVAAVTATAVEFAYPQIFPSYTANSQQPFTWIAQIVELGGVHLLDLVIGLVNGAVYEWLAARAERRRPPWRIAGLGFGAFAASVLYGAIRIPQIEAAEARAPKVRVGIAQNGVGAGMAHAHPNEGLRRLQKQTADLAARGAELVVWPESGFRGSLPADLTVLPPGLTGARVPVLIGALRRRYDPDGKRWSLNSAVMADAEGRIVGTFDKIRLLMFGEYIPFGDWIPKLYEWSPYSARFARGTSTAPLPFREWGVGAFICYEDILPRLVREIMQERGGERPHVLANLTNDSWYGDSHEPWIHLALASFRSIEHRRWMVRSTNTGLSAFVDAAGRIVQRTENFTEATLLAEVPMLEGTTVYQRIGDLVGWLSLLGVAGLVGYTRFSRRG